MTGSPPAWRTQRGRTLLGLTLLLCTSIGIVLAQAERAGQESRSRVQSVAFPATSNPPCPPLEWPLEYTLADSNVIMVNYPDNDASAQTKDYQQGTWSYDGHCGTDLTALSFRHSDRGMRVLAAASGTVIAVENSQPDRNYAGSGTANYVVLSHPGGWYTSYLHLRRNSVVVTVGDSVPAKTVLGLLASSGTSTAPHLHFELSKSATFGSYDDMRDPWDDSLDPDTSFWSGGDPEVYQGDTSLGLRILDAGYFTKEATGGLVSNVLSNDLAYFKERVPQPDTVSGDLNDTLAVWAHVQSPSGKSYSTFFRLDTLYGPWTVPVGGQEVRDGYFYQTFNWGYSGTGEILFVVGTDTVKRLPIVFGGTNSYPPRFTLAGKSVRLASTSQTDTLKLDALGLHPPVTFTALMKPDDVGIADSIVTFPPESSMSGRSTYFQVVAQNAFGRTDTMFYHIVDPKAAQDQPLPVLLSAFTARAVGDSVIFSWTTVTEVDNAGFVLDVSDGDAGWQELASYRERPELAGNGTSFIPKQYAFTLPLIWHGVVSFRLRSVDRYGEIRVCASVTVRRGADDVQTGYELGQFYPNPSNPSTTIRLSLPASAPLRLEVFDMAGRLLRVRGIDGRAGHQVISCDLAGIPSGTYVVRFRSGKWHDTRRLVVLR